MVTEPRCANRVGHVRQAIEFVVGEGEVGARRIINVGQVADHIVRIDRRTLGGCPTVGQSTVGIVPVVEEGVAEGICFGGRPAILVIAPGRRLALAVRQGNEIARGIVRVHERGDIIGLTSEPSGDIVAIESDVAQFIGERQRAGWPIRKSDAGIQGSAAL